MYGNWTIESFRTPRFGPPVLNDQKSRRAPSPATGRVAEDSHFGPGSLRELRADPIPEGEYNVFFFTLTGGNILSFGGKIQ